MKIQNYQTQQKVQPGLKPVKQVSADITPGLITYKSGVSCFDLGRADSDHDHAMQDLDHGFKMPMDPFLFQSNKKSFMTERSQADSDMSYTCEKQFYGDRFISMRSIDDQGTDNISESFVTKCELFEACQNQKSQEEKTDVETIKIEESKKAYKSLLHNQLLNLENEQLLNEIHDSDENQFETGLYSQLQKVGSNTPDIYNGAFAYTSPPQRILLSDTTNNQNDVSPFASRYTVLKFNSENKSSSKKSNKSHSSQGKNNFNFSHKSGKLADLKLDEQIWGKGIFSTPQQHEQIGTSTNSSVSNSLILDEQVPLFKNHSQIPSKNNKENPNTMDDLDYRSLSYGSQQYEFRPPSNIPSFKQTPFCGIQDEDFSILHHKKTRKIEKIPFKVLDAPQLRDDFYLNLVDWSDSNNLAVALSQCVYIWSASSSQVTKLHDYSETNDMTASVCWSRHGGQYLATGTHTGIVHMWDTETRKLIRTFNGHVGRVGALSWSNGNMLSSGSKDKSILNRDIRMKEQFLSRFEHHKQEICGLKWSFDDQYLASGGNDNKLMIWQNNCQPTQPTFKFSSHQAAVKAIAWSPHQSGLLASGGGTADRCIKFWNAKAGVELQSIDTGSQVCNLMWSKSSNEIVSTHGYSDNAICVWKYPSCKKIASLTGHSLRVLYLAMSPDAETVVTGAGDETLRFWKLFPKLKSHKTESCLDLKKTCSIR